MKHFGSCPRCVVRIELAWPPLPLGNCAACGARYLVTVPEDGGAPVGPELEGEVEVPLLLFKDEERRSWLEVRGLRKPAFFALMASGVLFLAFVATGLFAAVAPGTSHLLFGVFFVAALLLFVAVPLSATLAALVVRLLIERRERRSPRLFWSSVIAITAGVTALVVTAFILPGVAARLFGWGAAYTLTSWILPVLAGWATVRLAPAEPYRHAIGVVVVFVLGIGLLTIPAGPVVLGSLFYLANLPLLLLGAWLCVRFGSARSRPGTPA